MQNIIEEMDAEGAQHMTFVREWCDTCAYSWRDISVAAKPWLVAPPGRKGICLPTVGPSGPEIRLLALEGGVPRVYVSGGILKGVVDRGDALDAVNSWTRSNPAYPCFLSAQDPDGFSAMIQQQVFPLLLMQDTPAYVKSCIDDMIDVLLERRQAAMSQGLVGTPFSPQDDAYLLATSL